MTAPLRSQYLRFGGSCSRERSHGVAHTLKVAGATTFVAGLVIYLVAEHFWAYVDAPGTHDLTPRQRTAAVRAALNRGGIVALRERGDMDVLSREDIARIGDSRCIGEHECTRWERRRRRPFERCGLVRTNLYCAYEIVDTRGNTAAALVKTFREGLNSPPDVFGDQPEWLYEMMPTQRPEAETAKARLCEMGYCEPGALTRWKPPPRIDPPDPDAEARARCNGVLADIVSRGKTCLSPGDPAAREFRDCKGGFCGPLMVALPRGRYRRGTSDAEAERLVADDPAAKHALGNERPEREVTIDDHLAVGKFEVTFEEWDACVAQARCPSLDWSNYEIGERGKRPITSVSWNDITRHYLPWLNARLGLSGPQAYRLPTDAEWEYAARGGTVTRYAFGDTIARSDAQYHDGAVDAAGGRSVAVGAFRPNAFGLHDMHGNVAEWVEDCFGFMSEVADLPTDGSAARQERCSSRAIRGGGFADGPMMVRSASRSYNSADGRMKAVGLRLARTLERRR